MEPVATGCCGYKTMAIKLRLQSLLILAASILFAILTVEFTPTEYTDFPNRYDTKMRPHYDKHGRKGSFTGAGGVTISFIKFLVPLPREKAAILLLPDRGESYLKYVETIWDFNRRGYSVYAIDHRGQGFSERQPGVHNGAVSYVRSYHDYVQDVNDFVQFHFNDRPHRKRYILAPSMGGLIATLYLRRPLDHWRAIGVESWVSNPLLKTFRRLAAWFGGKSGRASESEDLASRSFASNLDFRLIINAVGTALF